MKPYTDAIFIAAICMTMLGLVNLQANADAWVAELSQVDPAPSDSVEIWVPAGEYTTVGVYNTEAVEVIAPPSVTCDVWGIWFEQRTVFEERPEEQDATIAYYLPPAKYWPTPDSFVVRMWAEAEGEHTVSIKCNTNTVTVTLHVAPSVPPADCGFGFYCNYQLFGYPEHWRQCFRHMREYGANTFTCYSLTGLDGRDVARQMDYAAEIGMADPQFPLFVLPDCGASNFGKLIEDARSKAKYADRWPELIGYNADEPSPSNFEQVASVAREYHECGFRTGTAISGAATLAFGELLDICCVHMDGITRPVLDKLRREDVEFWTYNCTLRGTNAPLHRYYTGVWTWKVRPMVNLSWGYMHDGNSKIREDGTWNALRVCEHALGTPDGPMSTVGLEGWREGIVDYRLLRELERQIVAHPSHEQAADAGEWLQDLSDRVDTRFWPGGRGPGYAQYYWDVPDTAVPPIADFNAMRKQALEYLDQLATQ